MKDAVNFGSFWADGKQLTGTVTKEIIMGRFTIKIKDKYFEYSTVVDAPITPGLSLEEYKEWYKEEYGNSKMDDLEIMLKRVEEKGTSNYYDKNLQDSISNNRAGLVNGREKKLTANQIYDLYKKEPEPDPAINEFRREIKEEYFTNNCENTIPEALRFLASNERPKYGNDKFNAEHLYQLADEADRIFKHFKLK